MLELRRPHLFPERQDRLKFRRTCEEEEDKIKYAPSPSTTYCTADSDSDSPEPPPYTALPQLLSSLSLDPREEASSKKTWKKLGLKLAFKAWKNKKPLRLLRLKQLSDCPSPSPSLSETKASTDSPPSSYRTPLAPSHHKEASTDSPNIRASPSPLDWPIGSPPHSVTKACTDSPSTPRTKKALRWLNSSLPLDPHKEDSSKAYTSSPSPCTVTDAEDCILFAQNALDFYNKEKASNYQLADALLSEIMVLWDGTWFHCNFVAKDGDSFPKLFFAEIIADTMTVTACLILDGCQTTVGCTLCKKAIHPTHGFIRGNHNRPKLDTIDSSPIVKSKSFPDEKVALPVNPMPYSEKVAEEISSRATAALDFYNTKNKVDYEIAGPLVSRTFVNGAYWVHCNFTAKPRNGDISPKPFFAEMHKENAVKCPWKATACLVLEGKTIDGCNFCHGIIHPIHGFENGNHKSQRKGLPPIIHPRLPMFEKRSRRAEIAMEYYNKENGTDYEVGEALESTGFSSDGTLSVCNSAASTWYHCNILAWRNLDGKYTRRVFFAEMFGDLLHGMEHMTVTICCNLEALKTAGCCAFCSSVIHPNHGYLKGVPKPTVYDSPFGLNFSSSSSIACPNPMEVPHPGRTRAKMALEYYNQKHGTEYELVDALGCYGLLSDGSWLHYNFTAMAPNGKSSPEHFFAEMLGLPQYRPIEFTWTVTACLILKEGKTTKGCYSCPGTEVIHPTHGFVEGLKND